MPHISIEHSKKVKSEIPLADLTRKLHQSLASQETIRLAAIKSRCIEIENLIVGDNESKELLHVQVQLLAGRSEELKSKMAKDLFEIIKNATQSLPYALSVNVTELGTYCKE